ncbi:hypothetical protein [Pseudoduganella namucuonensis]|uniref:Uncharacterized protein n=1 Tax=Pseudoduganella namucuonensis TaxID=1035707 RepID=A0A1I7L4A5_9BURK|nr:hypothetical protein [Pseudoduganella namucuonensis]SFV04537.1 hypothetical protein SAMN05216552_10236 [Pseudoduganella namucuonensis]
MNRDTATRLILRACVLVMSIGPARAQAPATEVVMLPAPAAQTELGDAPPPVQASIDPAAAAPAPEQRAQGSITRITLSANELPTVARRPLPPQPAPATHPMERDVQTLKAARAAMQLADALHGQRLAAMR